MFILKKSLLPLCFLVSQGTCIAFQLVLLVPSDLGEVRFGDPVYVPVAIANHGDKECEIPSLALKPGLVVIAYAKSESETIETNFSWSPYTTVLAARHVETSVLALNIWHPNLSVDFANGEQIVVDVSMSPNRSETVKKRFRFKISNSAFVDHKAFVDMAGSLRSRWSQDKDMIRCIGSRCYHLNLKDGSDSLALFGPLGWNVYDYPKGLMVTDYGQISDTPYYREMRGKVRKDCALFRAMRCAELRELLIRSKDQSRKFYAEFIGDYKLAMSNASFPEYQFLIRALSQVSLGWPHDEEFKRIISSEFPDVLAFLDPQRLGGQSTTSLLTNDK